MFNSINCTIFDIPLTWNRKSFEASRNKRRQARRLIEASINTQYNKQLRENFYEKLDIENDIFESQQRLAHQERKVCALDNLINVAEQSLDDYFEKRMENARAAIKEHCDAIRQILCEENEHWKEIHTAVDQHLITSSDIHRSDNFLELMPFADMDTITEAYEDEAQTSKLLNNKTVTPLLTRMMRKSRLQSNRTLMSGLSPCTSTQRSMHMKQEQFSFVAPLASARRTLPVIDTTFVIKAEESRATESNGTYHEEVASMDAVPTTDVEVLPIESVPTTNGKVLPMKSVPTDNVEVLPMEYVPTTDSEIMPSYSQPKPPAKLYFSPTLLHDGEEPEIIQPVLSTIDQNQISINKPKVICRRFGQTFLLDNLKTADEDEDEDQENLRPNISDEIPMIIPSKVSIPIEREPLQESNHIQEMDHTEEAEHQQPMVNNKRKVRAKRTKVLLEQAVEPVHATRRAGRKQKTPAETKQRQPRKRKQSTSDDTRKNSVASRKKKAAASPPKRTASLPKRTVSPPKPIVSPPKPKATTKKTRGKKAKEIPIREPSPLPVIDRLKHFSTRFSTRKSSHRSNNTSLPTAQIRPEEKTKPARLRNKPVARIRTRSQDGTENNRLTSTTRTKATKTQPATRSKSMMVTRNRRK